MQEKKAKKIEKIAIIIGVIIIPLMYSFFYLQAFWDPYAKLEDVSVAVVNLDNGGQINGEQKNMGEEICDNLKEEGGMGFVFTDKEDAEEGLLNQKYYATITIPEDFTENVSRIDSNKEKLHSTITYEANQKKNYLAAQILENAMPTIKQSVNETIDKEIVDTLCGKLDSVPGQMGELQDGLVLLADGSSDLKDGAGELDNGADKLLSGASELNEGAKKVAKGTKDLSKGADTLAAGTKKLNSAVSVLKDGSDALAAGAKELVTGAAAVDAGAKQLGSGAKQLSEYTGGVAQATGGAGTLNEGIKTYTGGVASAASGARELSRGIKTASAGVDQMTEAVASSMSQLPKDEQLDAISTGTANLTEAVKGMQQLMAAYQSTGDTKYLDQMNGVLGSISGDSLNSLNSGVSGLASGMKNVKANTSELSKGLKTLQAGFGDEKTEGTLLYGAAALDSGLQTLDSNSAALNKGASDLSSGLNILNGNSKALSAGIDSVVNGAAQVSGGAGTLSAGAGAFLGATSQMGDLTDGVSAINDGASELSKGAKTLKGGTAALAAGSGTLKAGIGTLKNGTAAFEDGAGQINDGIVTAKEGVDDSVADTKSQLKKLNGLPEYAEEPVSTDTQYLQPVANYGSAFAPYFMGLSLWVGCLMIFFGIYLDYHRKLERLSCGSKKRYLMAGAFGAVASVQGIALALMIKYILGITVNNMGLLIASCVLTSITFLFIIQFFVVYTGNIGKFIVMLLLILQLTSSAGTFPIETQTQFFIFINKILPMTYSTQLFKEAISGTAGHWAAYNAEILALFFVAFALLNIAGIVVAKAKEKRELAVQ